MYYWNKNWWDASYLSKYIKKSIYSSIKNNFFIWQLILDGIIYLCLVWIDWIIRIRNFDRVQINIIKNVIIFLSNLNKIIDCINFVNSYINLVLYCFLRIRSNNQYKFIYKLSRFHIMFCKIYLFLNYSNFNIYT